MQLDYDTVRVRVDDFGNRLIQIKVKYSLFRRWVTVYSTKHSEDALKEMNILNSRLL
jgi:hypothetical protein